MARILVVSHEASRTGAPRIAVHLAAGFVAAGHDTHVVVRWPGPLLADFRATGASVHLEPFRRLRVALRRFRRTRSLAVTVETAAATRVLRRVRPDVVWLNTALSACYAAPSADAGVAVVLHAHESEPFLSTVLGRYSLSRLWGRMRLVGCSPAVADALSGLAARPSGEVVVLASSVDVAAIREAAERGAASPAMGRPTIGACGRAGVGKGFETFLAIADSLADDVRFVWIGDVDTEVGRAEHDHVTDLVRRGVLTLAGELEVPYAELAALDAFVHPATNDSFPLVVLEAMALRKAVVASALEGIREEIGEAGILVAPGDVAAMASALRRVLDDPVLREHLGTSAARRVEERFSVGTMQRSAVELVQRALGDVRASSSSSGPDSPTSDS